MKPPRPLSNRDQDSGPLRKRGRTVALLFALAIPCVLAPAQVTQLLDLTVLNGSHAGARERARELRNPGSAAGPAPLSGLVRSRGRVELAVPRQFKVLTRWGGDRARRHQADPLGAGLVQRERAREQPRRSTTSRSAGPRHMAGSRPSDQMNQIEVHTGPNTWFRIYKWQFRLFDAAVVNGVPLVNPGRLDMMALERARHSRDHRDRPRRVRGLPVGPLRRPSARHARPAALHLPVVLLLRAIGRHGRLPPRESERVRSLLGRHPGRRAALRLALSRPARDRRRGVLAHDGHGGPPAGGDAGLRPQPELRSRPTRPTPWTSGPGSASTRPWTGRRSVPETDSRVPSTSRARRAA